MNRICATVNARDRKILFTMFILPIEATGLEHMTKRFNSRNIKVLIMTVSCFFDFMFCFVLTYQIYWICCCCFVFHVTSRFFSFYSSRIRAMIYLFWPREYKKKCYIDKTQREKRSVSKGSKWERQQIINRHENESKVQI